nr:hypothetical protein 12 [bacterium]
MAVQFVVEDGTSKSDATSYISVADMKQYWDDMGYDYSLLSDSQIQTLLNKCTQALDGIFFDKWQGYRSTGTQALQWPRADVLTPDGYDVNSSSIPTALKNALCELAYIKNSGVDIQPTDKRQGQLGSETVKVGPITRTWSFKEYRAHPNFPAVEDALKPLIGATGRYGGMELVRV